ncbi:MAG TPA: hypothetical protein VFH43_05395 [Candidatus Kapabacteria bacterium]|nr:hypothetical protein [Candidatus Kapabacteria bacterium]
MTKVLFGSAIIAFSFFQDGWPAIGLIGFIPVLTGAFNACWVAPLFGYTVWGERKPQRQSARIGEKEQVDVRSAAARA